MQIGIRPEHLLVNKDGDANWESKVLVVEKLGSGTFLYLEKNGEMLVVQTDGDSKIKVGDNVKIGFDATRCHIFDKSNKIISITGKKEGYASKNSDVSIIFNISNNKHITPHTEGLTSVIWHLLVSHPLLKINETKWESIK